MNTERLSRPWTGLLTATVGVAVLTAFAACVPADVRKLLLFSLAFGLCAGGIVVWAAREFGLNRRWAATLTVPLVLVGLTVIALLGHRQLLAEHAAARSSPEQKKTRSILQAAADNDPELASEPADREALSNPSFADYLAGRVRPLGEWRQPWPVLFWGAEGLLAAAAGALLVSRLLRERHHRTEKHP